MTRKNGRRNLGPRRAYLARLGNAESEALERMAALEQRTLNNMLQVLIRESAERRGIVLADVAVPAEA